MIGSNIRFDKDLHFIMSWLVNLADCNQFPFIGMNFGKVNSYSIRFTANFSFHSRESFAMNIKISVRRRTN